LKNVDQIVVFHKGQIVESGTFNELLFKGGRFAQLWDEAQSTLNWGVKKTKDIEADQGGVL
jgi:ABC-type transport system involved in cytochrome bd biosynthesis fused ATPase/permease subunit